MKETMDHRRQYKTDIGNKNHATKKGIQGREPDAGIAEVVQHRSHARKQHGSIVKRIEPTYMRAGAVKANDPYQEGNNQYHNTRYQVLNQSHIEDRSGSKRFAFVFVHEYKLMYLGNKCSAPFLGRLLE